MTQGAPMYRADLLQGPLSQQLDHLRWLSALAVAASHLRNAIFPDANGQQLNLIEQAFYFVTLFATEAVVIFFVMSGLLVGGSILRKFDTRKYAVDRVTRLYAALIPALVLTLALQWGGMSIDCKAPDGAPTIAANLAFIQIFSGQLLCNNVSLWSLSSEAYCYLIGPCLILALRDRSPWAALIAALLLIPAILVATPMRSTPLFTLGLWLCGLVPWFVRLRLNAWIAAAPVLVTLIAGRLHLFPSEMLEEVVLAATFTLLLCSDFQQRTPPLRDTAHRLAAFSYSLYLVQMPLSQFAGWAVGRQNLPNGEMTSYLIYTAFLGLIVLIAWIFGQLFEKQTPHLRRAILTRLDQSAATSARK